MPQFVPGFIADNAALISALSAASIVLLGISILATPWLIARLPQDYFSRPRPATRERGALRVAILLVRNVAGVLFMLLGVLMLVAPGPGLIGIVLGLSLCEFPGKHALLRRLAGHPPVFRSLNWLRSRRRAVPFDAP